MARRCAMERVIVVEDHSAFAQALELVLGQVDGTEVALVRALEEGRALIRGASLSNWWCST